MRPKLAESPGCSFSTSGWLICRRPPNPSVTLPEASSVSPGENPLSRQAGGLKKTRSSEAGVRSSPSSAAITLRMGRPLRIRWTRTTLTRASTLASSPRARSRIRRTAVRSW